MARHATIESPLRTVARARVMEVDGTPITVTSVARHRNGMCGAPFHVVMFTHGDRPMVGVVFETADHVAVFDRTMLADGVADFGANSWRGDRFEKALRRAIRRRS